MQRWRQRHAPLSRHVALGVALCLALAYAHEPIDGRQRGPLPAPGVVEGRIVLRNDTAGKVADRYVGSGGEPRDVPRLPVVVRIEGAVPGAPPAKPSGPLEIVQRGESFSPLLLVVPVGSTVAFPNADPLFHNVFSYSKPKRFDLGRYRRGESKSVVFDKPGYVKVMCEVHKWMRNAVVVVENPYYAAVMPGGTYRLEGIPPGRYRLLVEHFDRRPYSADVEVREGATTQLDLTL